MNYWSSCNLLAQEHHSSVFLTDREHLSLIIMIIIQIELKNINKKN